MYKIMSDGPVLIKTEKAQKKDTNDNNLAKFIPEKLNLLTPKVMTVLEFFLSYPLTEYYEREVSRKLA
jgi:hypothetical protein